MNKYLWEQGGHDNPPVAISLILLFELLHYCFCFFVFEVMIFYWILCEIGNRITSPDDVACNPTHARARSLRLRLHPCTHLCIHIWLELVFDFRLELVFDFRLELVFDVRSYFCVFHLGNVIPLREPSASFVCDDLQFFPRHGAAANLQETSFHTFPLTNTERIISLVILEANAASRSTIICMCNACRTAGSWPLQDRLPRSALLFNCPDEKVWNLCQQIAARELADCKT